jgi:hypothetical protein
LAAYEPESKPPVENDKKTTYDPSDMERSPDTGGATLDQELDRIEAKFGEAAKEAFARRAPARDGAVNSGMVARELTGRAAPVAEPATHPRDLSKPQVVAVIEDSTLGRLHRRYTELLEMVERPKDGFKTVEQARDAARLSTTFDNLQARRQKVGLQPLPKDDRVLEAKRLSVAFYRQRSPKSAREGRHGGKAATLG